MNNYEDNSDGLPSNGEDALTDIVYTIRAKNIDEGMKSLLISRGESLADMVVSVADLLSTAVAAQAGIKPTKSVAKASAAGGKIVYGDELAKLIVESRQGLATLLRSEEEYRTQFSDFVNKISNVNRKKNNKG